MKKIKTVFGKWGGAALAILALLFGVTAANSACLFWYHQPREPQSMEKFKRY
jgi:cyclic lactone autoinducer peptide